MILDAVTKILALTLWFECRGESIEGKRFTASVIWNRAAEPKGKYDLSWVVLRPRQFSCWNNRDTRNLTEPDRDFSEDKVWDDCVAIATEMVNGTFMPVTDATHYFNPNKVMPEWADALRDVQDVGRHRFGRMK